MTGLILSRDPKGEWVHVFFQSGSGSWVLPRGSPSIQTSAASLPDQKELFDFKQFLAFWHPEWPTWPVSCRFKSRQKAPYWAPGIRGAPTGHFLHTCGVAAVRLQSEIGCPNCDCGKWVHMILRSTGQSKLLLLFGTEIRTNEMKALSQNFHMPQPLPSHSHLQGAINSSSAWPRRGGSSWKYFNLIYWHGKVLCQKPIQGARFRGQGNNSQYVICQSFSIIASSYWFWLLCIWSSWVMFAKVSLQPLT